jgi:hypothetical protein
MTNSARGIPAVIRVVGRARRSAPVSTRYRQPLVVRVLDASGVPVSGVSVTFTLGTAGAGSGATGAGSAGAGASFTSGAPQVVVTTNGAGIAVSPHFDADTVGGPFTATATLTSGTKRASFALHNRAGTPRAVTAGAATSQSARAGTPFPIRLAVVVTDAYGNPVQGALVTFAAPARGASGTFAGFPNAGARVVRVRANALGIAVAPVFRADRSLGGYAVKASTGDAVAAFALVNEPSERPA